MVQNRYESTSTHSFSSTVASYGVLPPNHGGLLIALEAYQLCFGKNPGIFEKKLRNQPHTLLKMDQNRQNGWFLGHFGRVWSFVGPQRSKWPVLGVEFNSASFVSI